MGRAKLSLELKGNKKARCVTFEKRRKGLEKKAFELSTLCGVKVGMILYGPSEDNEQVGPTIWPENREEIEHLISSYSYKKRSYDHFCRQGTYNLSSFYKDKLKKVREELAKTRKRKNNKYPTWNKEYDKLTSQELKSITGLIQDKIETVKSRINLIKATRTMMTTCDPKTTNDLFDVGTTLEKTTMMMNNGASASSSGGNENLISQDFGFGLLDNARFPNDESTLMCSYLPMPTMCVMPENLQYPFYDLQDQVCLY